MTGPDLSTISAIVEAASRAPSVHNSQPWRWDWDGTRLHLYADWERQLRHGDPDGRDLVISCGAVLHHAFLAAAGHGWLASVHRLPHRPDDRVLASLDLRPVGVNPVSLAALEVLRTRVTDRRTPSSTPVPRDKLDGLVRAALIHGAFVTELPDESTDELRDLMMLSSVLQENSPAYLEELAAWTNVDGDDGVPASSIVFGGKGDSRFFQGRLLDHAPPPQDERPRQHWMLLTTSSDDLVSRLRAGEALSAVMVMAAMQGLAVVPYTQPIEVDTTRWGIEQALLRGSSNLQVILRVAVPPPGAASVRRTRRRGLDEILSVHGLTVPA